MIDRELINAAFIFLKSNNIKLVTCESLTGGLIASEITKIKGASNVFWGGSVVYNCKAKIELAQVPFYTIKEYGVVSYQTVKAMASGAIISLLKGQNEYVPAASIAVSGVAGPDTLEGYNAGTVWIGTAFFPFSCTVEPNYINHELPYFNKEFVDKNLIYSIKKYSFTGSRNDIREKTVNTSFTQIISLCKSQIKYHLENSTK